MTAISRSRSNGAVDMRSHMARQSVRHWKCGIEIDQKNSRRLRGIPAGWAGAGFDLDQPPRAEIRRKFFDDSPPTPFRPPLPALRRRHAGQQVARRYCGFRHLPVPEVPDHDQRAEVGPARRERTRLGRASRGAGFADRGPGRGKKPPHAQVVRRKMLGARVGGASGALPQQIFAGPLKKSGTFRGAQRFDWTGEQSPMVVA